MKNSKTSWKDLRMVNSSKKQKKALRVVKVHPCGFCSNPYLARDNAASIKYDIWYCPKCGTGWVIG